MNLIDFKINKRWTVIKIIHTTVVPVPYRLISEERGRVTDTDQE